MEKTTKKTKSKIFSFLPQTAFQNHPFSPGRDHNNNKRSSETNLQHKFKPGSNSGGKAWSGPLISMIPAEARIKSKSGRTFDAQEPTSPKISCMGQIKHKKIAKCKFVPMTPQPPKKEKKPKRPSQGIRSIFGGGGKKADEDSVNKKKSATIIRDHKAPVLGQMKRFASSREGALVDFDWKYYSERDDSDDEDEVIVPHSAPMMIGGGKLEPRKEVNLWKRRTMDPPRPLQLNAIR
ncbi:hypothetical protein ACHQM5_024559 [Ranunculus cassubicifolius]